MASVHFWLDDAPFQNLPRGGRKIEGRLRRLIAIGEEVALERGLPLNLFAGIFSWPTRALGAAVADVIYSEAFCVSVRDFARRLHILLDRCEKVTSETVPTPKFEMTATGRKLKYECYALESIVGKEDAKDKYCVMLWRGTNGFPDGVCEISRKSAKRELYVLSDIKHLPKVYRRLIAAHYVSEGEFIRTSEHAFPRLLLHPGIRFRKFSRSYNAIKGAVVKHLAYLNDDFLQDARRANWDIRRLTETAAAQGVQLSDESPNTKANRAAMKEREVYFGSEKVVCTLHTKIERNRDRIHFHPPIKTIDTSRVLVGIFAEHLTT